jgi:hypothetical protein
MPINVDSKLIMHVQCYKSVLALRSKLDGQADSTIPVEVLDEEKLQDAPKKMDQAHEDKGLSLSILRCGSVQVLKGFSKRSMHPA